MLFHCDSQCDAYPVSALNSSLFSEFCYSVIWNFQSGYFTVNALNYSWIQFCHSVWFQSRYFTVIALDCSWIQFCHSVWFQSRYFTVIALNYSWIQFCFSVCDSKVPKSLFHSCCSECLNCSFMRQLLWFYDCVHQTIVCMSH